jgi:hypothetical protein
MPDILLGCTGVRVETRKLVSPPLKMPKKKFAADQVVEQRRYEAVELSNKADNLDKMADITIEPERQKQYRQRAEEYREKPPVNYRPEVHWRRPFWFGSLSVTAVTG